MKKNYIIISIIITIISVFTVALSLDGMKSRILSSLTDINTNNIIIRDGIVIFNYGTTPFDIETILDKDIQVFDGETEIENLSIIKTNEILRVDDEDYPIAILGDVFADGVINVRDLAKAYTGLSKPSGYNSYSEPEKKALDYNNDGVNNILDLGKIYLRMGGEDSNTITIDKTELGLAIGESETITASIIDSSLEDKTITYISSNDNIATVDQNGLITAISTGKALITATSSNGKIAKCRVTISSEPRQKITIPTLVLDSFTYTGETITPAVVGYNSDLMEITGKTSSKNAGSYSMTISLLDKEHYEWEDNSDDSITLSWTISKASREAPTVTSYSGVYDGNPHKLIVLEDNIEYSEDGENWTNIEPTRTEIGTTTIYVRIEEDTNHYASVIATGTITITEQPAPTVQIPTTSMCNDLTYNGELQVLTKTPELGYIFTDNEQTNAGTYTVTASLLEGYVWNDQTTETKEISCEIKKLKIIKPVMEVTSYEYTGSNITPVITGYDENTMDIDGILSAKNVGNYTVTISLKNTTNMIWNDNTNLNVVFNWEINALNVNKLTINPNGGNYSGNTEITQDTGTDYSIRNNLTKEGYIFGGFKLSGIGTYNRRDTNKIILSGDDANYISRKDETYRTTDADLPVVYNTLGNGSVAVKIVTDDTNSTYGYSLRVKTTGEASPGLGGIYINDMMPDNNKNKVDIIRVRAKVPNNYVIKLAGITTNNTGYGSRYLYETNEGTGDWKNYYFYVYTGNSGEFTKRVYVYIDKADETVSSNVTWYLDSVYRYEYNKSSFYSSYTFGEGNGKLTALWSASGSRVTYDTNGGTITDDTRYTNFTYDTVYDSQKLVPYNMSNSDYTIHKDGYTFRGWYTAKSGGVQVFDRNGSLKSNVEDFSSSKTWKKYENVTLYAKWGPIEAQSITLDREASKLNEGGQIQLFATVLPSNTTDKTVTWASSNSNYVTVDENGLVTAIKPGKTVTITATTSNGLIAECTVTVRETLIIDNLISKSSTTSDATTNTSILNESIIYASENDIQKVKLKKGTYYVKIGSKSEINLKDKIKLDLNGSTIKMIPTDNVGYDVFSLVEVRNVSISNGTIVGDKLSHDYASNPDSTHEQGMGIRIQSSANITIENMFISKTTGDGIYIIDNTSSDTTRSTNINIRNNEIYDCRRNGISIISGDDVDIYNNNIHEIGIITGGVDGTNPREGIDIERNNIRQTFTNSKIRNNKIYGNARQRSIMLHKGIQNLSIKNNELGNGLFARSLSYCYWDGDREVYMTQEDLANRFNIVVSGNTLITGVDSSLITIDSSLTNKFIFTRNEYETYMQCDENSIR